MPYRSTPGLRNVVVLAMLVLFVMIVFLAPTYLPSLLPTQGNDAQTVASLSTVTTTAETFDGYAAVSIIYAHTNEIIRTAMMLAFGAAMIAMFLWWLRMPRMLLLGCFCLISPLILYLSFFTKDTFVTPVMVAALAILIHHKFYPLAKICLVASIYLAYAFVFRQYYIIIVAAWLFVLIFMQLSWGWRIVMLVMVPLVLLVVPAQLYDTLQSQRDLVNYSRVGIAGEGNRTAFLNLVRPDGLQTFFINYAFAAWRLNIPIISIPGAGPKELYLFVNLLIYAWLTMTGMRSHNKLISWPAGLFFSHVLVLTIFEPDLGSYLRHLSSSLVLLAPSLAMHDSLLRRNRVKGENNMGRVENFSSDGATKMST